ncbi:MAG: hypothetical protein GY869_14025 [Planctomycetes bacterium]|nr:hypothetical protein [Planctomycetota bacterium]
MLLIPIRYGFIIIGAVIIIGNIALSKMSGFGDGQNKASQNIPQQAFFYQTGFPQSASDDVAGPSSPVVADVDGDGDQELFLAGVGWVYGWNHHGNLLPGFPVDTGDGVIVASLVAADLDNDDDLEIIAGTGSSGQGHNRARVFAWHHTGSLVTGWPQDTQWNSIWAWSWSWNEITSVAVADIDGDGDNEVLATSTASTAEHPNDNPPDAFNAYIWHHDGTPVTGWPTSAGPWPEYDNRVGIYGLLAAGDFDGDGIANPVLPRDYNILYAYDGQGDFLNGWPTLVFYDPNGTWGQDSIEFGVSAPVLADLDRDGTTEMINIGYRRIPSGTRTNSALMVFEPNGSRRTGWEYPAQGSGWLQDQVCAPYGIVSIANLDADPDLEIIASTNDGFIRAYDPDKSLLWSFDYTLGNNNIVAGEAVVGDIDGDGQVEIIFGTYDADFNATTAARIWALEKDGSQVADPNFPITDIGDRNIGLCSTPTLADLDNDGDVELIVNRKADAGQLAVWDLPGIYNPLLMPWPQGRHDAQRTATYIDLAPNLTLSRHAVSPNNAVYNETIKFYLTIHNGGAIAITDTITATVQIPVQLTDTQNVTLVPNIGTAITGTNTLTWTGILSQQQKVTVSYDARVNITDTLFLSSTATVEHATLGALQRTAVFLVNPKHAYLPIVLK